MRALVFNITAQLLVMLLGALAIVLDGTAAKVALVFQLSVAGTYILTLLVAAFKTRRKYVP